jgi:hypothetical protein
MALHGYDRPTSVKEIAERTGLPQPYLEQILLAVKGAGLARSNASISENTVKSHLTHIFNKSGASSRVELALFAAHHRLLQGL